jgi:N-acetylglucosamine repressor
MGESQIGNSELISTVNSRLVLQAVRIMQPTYRAAVARQTGLKAATITAIVNGLITEQMLRETESPDAARTRWGRPPLMLEVNGDAKRILAIDLEPDRIRVALTNILIEEQVYREKPVDRFSKPHVVCREILKLCKQVLEGMDHRRVLGVGVSLPGLIDREEGVLLTSTNMPEWRNVAIGPLLSSELGVPVHVERSTHLAALYEKWSDPQQQDRTILIISVRTGIGMSVMHRGELYNGNHGFDGEIGHTVVDRDGPVCECGNRGCLETYIGASAICAKAQAEIDRGCCMKLAAAIKAGEPLRPPLIYRLGAEGDADCAAIVRYVGQHLGIAVSNMINLLAPHEVVVCGSIDTAGELVLEAMREEIDRRALPRTRSTVTLRLARQREKLPLLGAAVLIAQDLFQLPRLRHGAFLSLPATRDGPRRSRASPRKGGAMSVID